MVPAIRRGYMSTRQTGNKNQVGIFWVVIGVIGQKCLHVFSLRTPRSVLASWERPVKYNHNTEMHYHRHWKGFIEKSKVGGGGGQANIEKELSFHCTWTECIGISLKAHSRLSTDTNTRFFTDFVGFDLKDCAIISLIYNICPTLFGIAHEIANPAMSRYLFY